MITDKILNFLIFLKLRDFFSFLFDCNANFIVYRKWREHLFRLGVLKHYQL